MSSYWNPDFELMPWSEVQRYWINELEPFVTYITERSSFYREKMKKININNIKSVEQMREIPFLTKDVMREVQLNSDRNKPLGINQIADTENIVQVISSSGTSGRPVYYGITPKDLKIWKDVLSTFFYTAGIRKTDIVAHIVGVPLFAGGDPYFEGIRNIGALTVWPGGLSTARILETIRNLHCNVIQATVSFDIYLSEHCQDTLGINARELGIKKVLGGGESGLGEETIRRKLKENWGAETVREIMGLADVLPGMWSECEEESGMHFNAQQHVMVELIDPKTGEPLPWETGVCGEPVYTTLHREATPVLRYRSADLIRVEGVSCKCGRTSPRIRCIGRVDDMLVFKAMNVFPSAIRDVVLQHFEPFLTGHLQIVKENANQVRFDTPIPVDIEVKSLDENQSALKQKIEQKVRDLLNVRIQANFVAPDTLPRTQYKTPLVRVRK